MGRELFNGIINRINLVGIELEGGWDRAVDNHHVERDGSVVFEDPNNTEVLDRNGRRVIVPRPVPIPFPAHAIGEIVSRAMPVGSVEEWIRKAYPQHVNNTCGLHVHMSFHTKLNYSRLMLPDYMNMMVDELKRFADAEKLPTDHMLRNRLDPNHPWTLKHCAHTFLADRQVLVKGKDFNSRGKPHSRYTFINYPEMQHHTVECRGLSMFGGQPTKEADVEMAVRAVLTVINTTNRFLSKIRQREQPVSVGVIEQPTYVHEVGRMVR